MTTERFTRVIENPVTERGVRLPLKDCPARLDAVYAVECELNVMRRWRWQWTRTGLNEWTLTLPKAKSGLTVRLVERESGL